LKHVENLHSVGAKVSAVAAAVSREESYAEKLQSVPELVALGPLFRSSEPVELTESETEYVVRCVKHCFPQHLVLQVK
jgi:coatomer protein complex subunit gamma